VHTPLTQLSGRAGDGCVAMIEPLVEIGVSACQMKPLIQPVGD